MSAQSTTARLRDRFQIVWALFAAPAVLVHELTHAVASVPWAAQLAVVVEPSTGRAVTRVEWRESAGQTARAFAALAPFLGGLVAAAGAVTLWFQSGATVPSETTALGKWAILSAWWVIYMMPSPADAETARGEGDADA